MKNLNDEIKRYILDELGEQAVFEEVDTKYYILVCADLVPAGIEDDDGNEIAFVVPEDDFDYAVREPDASGWTFGQRLFLAGYRAEEGCFWARIKSGLLWDYTSICNLVHPADVQLTAAMSFRDLTITDKDGFKSDLRTGKTRLEVIK